MKRYFSREYLIKLREKFETIAPKTDRLLLRFVKASLPHLAGNSVESAVRRLWDRRRLVRVSPGVYKLAPPPKLTPAPAPEPAPPEPAPAPGDGHTDEEWYALLEAWAADQSSWNAKANGPPPNVVGNNVPPDIRIRFSDRLRKRQERARDREAAAAKQAAADAALRDRLLAVTNGNFVAGHAIDDVSPIKMAMEIVPFDSILSAIQYKTDKKLYPLNEPATSWRERRLLKAIAEHYARFDLVPRLVSAWSAARTTQKPTERAEASPAARGSPRAKKRAVAVPAAP